MMSVHAGMQHVAICVDDKVSARSTGHPVVARRYGINLTGWHSRKGSQNRTIVEGYIFRISIHSPSIASISLHLLYIEATVSNGWQFTIDRMATSIPCTLSELHRHSIFSPTGSEAGDQQAEWELLERPSDAEVGAKKQRIAIRHDDLIVAVGNELRILTLTGESWDEKDGRVGKYKVIIRSGNDSSHRQGRS